MTGSDGDPPTHSDPERVPDTDPIAAAERTAAALSSDGSPRGTLGPRFDRHSPFFTGITAAAGALTTVAVVLAARAVESILILIGVAFFLALGIEPLVRWVTARRVPRWAAVTGVFVVGGAALTALVAAAVPPLTEQASALIAAARTTSNNSPSRRRGSVA
ncbi:AI-2E family transporter [Rhodococcus coprophilus]|uniref:AI-2E family transporter n=1 Tax=Rhodococcus coprophilus TaxID=38310 RepID=UPI0037A75389